MTATRPLLFRGLFIGALLGLFAWSIATLSVNDGAGEGANLDPHSFRYSLGVWLDKHCTFLIVIAAWPLVVLSAFGIHHLPAWVSFPACLAAGIGWVYLYHQLSYLRREFARILQR